MSEEEKKNFDSCEQCQKTVQCEGRESWIFGEQYYICLDAGKPAFEDEDFFLCPDPVSTKEQNAELFFVTGFKYFLTTVFLYVILKEKGKKWLKL